MKYQIDQSGKIEDTGRNTVLAYSNSKQYSIFISKKIKRQVQEILRKHGFIRLYIYLTFGIALYFLIKELKQPKKIIIDREYPGKEELIKTIVCKLLDYHKKPSHDLNFDKIGNRPKVHYAAKDVFDKKVKADKNISLEDILKELKMTDGRLRGCLSTLVDAQPRSINKQYHNKGKKSR